MILPMMSGTRNKAPETSLTGGCLDVVSLLPLKTFHPSLCKSVAFSGLYVACLIRKYDRYVFGGMSNNTATSDGNVYVLSIPSFRWIKLDGSKARRIKHKCQLGGKHTMLVVGGTVPTKNSEYEPKQSDCDSDTFANGIGIFNLNEHQWLTNFDADDDEYTIDSSISKVIGGGYVLSVM